ncbi:MAG: recombinase family protein [Lachnospiraceae bacterium]|nr:recombinase family protein [Lachnospiraceae bacterium]
MYAAGSMTAKKEYVVCLYVRLSIEDDDVSGSAFKTESGSITTQRALLHDYIKNRKEFKGCKVIEKCDDGFSGTHFDNRPQFTEMIELAKKGKIDCIIVKDFSRFGRDYVELGNYLEQLFPFMGVRFISVNDNYDSAELAEGTTGGLDVAFKNLIYDYYSREMSRKQRIAWQRMAEQGQYNSTCALYGYRKSKEDKHKLVIEPEEAEVVREIFNMKIAGTGTTLIARALNDRGIPCPSELYRSRGDTRKWKNKGNPCYWTASKIEAIIRDEKYTGTMVQLKTKLDGVGGKQVNRPREEWVRVENTHEPIITYPQYIRAVSSLKQQKAKESKNFKNIYYCGCCGRALFNAHYGTVFCKQRSFKTDSDCRDIEIKKQEADMSVLEAVKEEAELFLDRDKLSRQVIKRNSPLSVSDRINSTMRSIEAAQKSWIALYDKYADGKLEREFFLNEKKQYDADMEKLEQELAALRQAQEEEETEQEGSQRKADQAMAFLEEEELTEDMKEKLIEKVIVYPASKIEIVWKYKGHSIRELV